MPNGKQVPPDYQDFSEEQRKEFMARMFITAAMFCTVAQQAQRAQNMDNFSAQEAEQKEDDLGSKIEEVTDEEELKNIEKAEQEKVQKAAQKAELYCLKAKDFIHPYIFTRVGLYVFEFLGSSIIDIIIYTGKAGFGVLRDTTSIIIHDVANIIEIPQNEREFLPKPPKVYCSSIFNRIGSSAGATMGGVAGGIAGSMWLPVSPVSSSLGAVAGSVLGGVAGGVAGDIAGAFVTSLGTSIAKAPGSAARSIKKKQEGFTNRLSAAKKSRIDGGRAESYTERAKQRKGNQSEAGPIIIRSIK